MSTLRILVLAAAACAWGACHATEPTPDQRAAQRFAEIAAAYPCIADSAISIKADSGLADVACSLTRIAVHEVAIGAAERLGINRSDTGRVYASSVIQMRFRSLDGKVADSHWLVTLSIRNAPREVTAHISQFDGDVVIAPAEE